MMASKPSIIAHAELGANLSTVVATSTAQPSFSVCSFDADERGDKSRVTEDSWRTRARTISAPRRQFGWKRRGGPQWVLYLAAWSFQISCHSVMGTALEAGVTTEARNVDDGVAVGKQKAGQRALQIGGLQDGERGRFDDGGLELVVLEPNLVDEELFKPLTIFLRYTCNAGEDRECLNAHVDRELLELGDSNHIILGHDLSSQPRVAERKTSHSQPPHGCPRRASHRSFAIHQAPIA